VLLGQSPPEAIPLQRGPLRIDTLRRVVWNGDRRVPLGTSEWGLLLALCQVDGTISPGDLLAGVWGEDYRDELAFLRLWTNRLRGALGDDPRKPHIVLGDEQTGFRLAE
jgi:two-component system KDP operon response regulator KdpE